VESHCNSSGRNLEEQEDIEKIERRTEKLRREAVERLDKDNALESKIT